MCSSKYLIQNEEYEELQGDLRFGTGPMCQEVEKYLQVNGMRRQAYHSNTFVGNHVDKFLKVKCTYICVNRITHFACYD